MVPLGLRSGGGSYLASDLDLRFGIRLFPLPHLFALLGKGEMARLADDVQGLSDGGAAVFLLLVSMVSDDVFVRPVSCSLRSLSGLLSFPYRVWSAAGSL